MTTKEIVNALRLTAQLMELHNENPFKIKSIANAAYRLNKTDVILEGNCPWNFKCSNVFLFSLTFRSQLAFKFALTLLETEATE